MNRKKIALLKWTFDNVGGGEKVAVNLSNELVDYYDVYLISLNSTNLPFYPINDRVNYINLGSGKKRIREGFISNLLKLRKFLKDNQIELIFSIGVSTNVFMLLSTCFTKVKTVFCEHTNTAFKEPGKIHILQRYLGAKFANKIVTLTEEDKLSYINEYNIKTERIQSIYNWIEEFEQPLNIAYNPAAKKLITVGRFTQQKGYDLLVKVANKLYKKHPDWVWDIYGTGEDAIKNELSKLPNIYLKGVVQGSYNIFPEHAIYVMTSYYEGLPLVLLEAKQFKLPIISFRCPTGPSEIIRDGENGFLIDNYDVDLMFEKISVLIEDFELRKRFSDNANIDYDKFSKDKIIKQWLNLIGKLLNE
ncbi:glycosyltransferase family 4 protein [Ursidibacter sp. B-7004-1]